LNNEDATIQEEHDVHHINSMRTQAIRNTERKDKAKGVGRALDAVNTAEVVGLG